MKIIVLLALLATGCVTSESRDFIGCNVQYNSAIVYEVSTPIRSNWNNESLEKNCIRRDIYIAMTDRHGRGFKYRALPAGMYSTRYKDPQGNYKVAKFEAKPSEVVYIGEIGVDDRFILGGLVQTHRGSNIVVRDNYEKSVKSMAGKNITVTTKRLITLDNPIKNAVDDLFSEAAKKLKNK
jgi:hypothetical protein